MEHDQPRLLTGMSIDQWSKNVKHQVVLKLSQLAKCLNL